MNKGKAVGIILHQLNLRHSYWNDLIYRFKDRDDRDKIISHQLKLAQIIARIRRSILDTSTSTIIKSNSAVARKLNGEKRQRKKPERSAKKQMKKYNKPKPLPKPAATITNGKYNVNVNYSAFLYN